MAGRRRKLVKFKATKVIKKPVRVRFTTWDGEEVSFKAYKTLKKKVPVEFYTKKKKKRR